MTVRLVKKSEKEPEKKEPVQRGTKQVISIAQSWVEEFKARRSQPDPFLVKLKA
jgi:hypothetical protein